MSSFLKNICFVFYLQIALTNTVLADKKLDQYLVDITPLLNKSKSVIFFDAKKKSLTTIKGAESNTYIKHYKKLGANENLVGKPVFQSKKLSTRRLCENGS